MSFVRNLIQPLEPRRLLTVSSGFAEDVVGSELRLPTAIAISPAAGTANLHRREGRPSPPV